MEIRTYLNILLRYWWLVLLGMVAGGAIMAVVDRVQQPIYATEARVAVRPTLTLTDSRAIIDLVGQMGGRYIVGNFAQSFTSAQVQAAARQAAGIGPDEVDDYVLEANILPDSSVVQVNGTGPDPTTLVNYVNASLAATVNDTRELFRVMELVPLETASIPDPNRPIAPQPARDIPLGAAIGLGLGIVLALSIDYLRGLGAAGRPARAPGTVPGAAPVEAGRE
jgi:capsular polysaccharide biosynthesis protein